MVEKHPRPASRVEGALGVLVLGLVLLTGLTLVAAVLGKLSARYAVIGAVAFLGTAVAGSQVRSRRMLADALRQLVSNPEGLAVRLRASSDVYWLEDIAKALRASGDGETAEAVRALAEERLVSVRNERWRRAWERSLEGSWFRKERMQLGRSRFLSPEEAPRAPIPRCPHCGGTVVLRQTPHEATWRCSGRCQRLIHRQQLRPATPVDERSAVQRSSEPPTRRESPEPSPPPLEPVVPAGQTAASRTENAAEGWYLTLTLLHTYGHINHMDERRLGCLLQLFMITLRPEVTGFVVERQGADGIEERSFRVDRSRLEVLHELLAGWVGTPPRLHGAFDTSDRGAAVHLRLEHNGRERWIELQLMSSGYEGADAPAFAGVCRTLLTAVGVSSPETWRDLVGEPPPADAVDSGA